MNTANMPQLILRIGVAFAFLYPAINALWNPTSWIAYFPPWSLGYIPDVLLLHAFGALEMAIAVWLLSGWRIFWPAIAAAAILVAIVIVDFYTFEVLFRDLSIAAAALALALLTRENTSPHMSGQRDRL